MVELKSMATMTWMMGNGFSQEPPVDDITTNHVTEESLSQLQPLTPTRKGNSLKTSCPEGSPTPQHRQSKTLKQDESFAGKTAAMDTDLDVKKDDDNKSATAEESYNVILSLCFLFFFFFDQSTSCIAVIQRVYDIIIHQP